MANYVCNLIFLMMFLAPSAFSEKIQPTSAAEGYTIMETVYEKSRGWGDSVSQSTMVMYRGDKELTRRTFSSKSLERENSSEYSLLLFEYPKDVRGTSFLTYSYSDKPNDQWLYLPALHRTKRISSKGKTGKLLGSEFTYEDLQSFKVDDYQYLLVDNETGSENNLFVVDAFPADKDSGYSKLIFYIDQQYRIQRVDYYNAKNDSLEKRAVYSEFQLYNGRFWRPHKVRMASLVSNNATTLITDNLELNVGLAENVFNRSNLSR